MKIIKAIFGLLKEAAARWGQDKAHLLAAALTYYMVFAMAPLLVIALGIVTAVLGEAVAQGTLFGQLEQFMGPETAGFIFALVQNVSAQRLGSTATIIGVIVLLYAATNVFYQLKMVLNRIWRIDVTPQNGIVEWLKSRGQALLLVLTIGLLGLLLVVSTLVQTTVLAILDELGIIQDGSGFWFQTIALYLLIMVMFAIVLKVLPDAHVAWRDVWLGAAVTAFFFIIGEYVLSIFLRFFLVTSIYGAAGSLIAVLYWVYYSTQILLLGAEFTYVYANIYGSKVRLSERAVVLPRTEHSPPPPPPEPEPRPVPEPAPPPLPEPETEPSPARRVEREAAFGLIGLAIGLLAAFLLGRKR
ncbi:MAG TPA: YihY/virulence factor BrkB family protein [Anaerolineae bacterium]|nr:YihY/virulence factor BrkB family protein [Anaerolineae bacterium]